MYFICICCFRSITILFQNYPFLSEPFSVSTLKRHTGHNVLLIGELFVDLQNRTDFKEMKRLCIFAMPFLYDWVFIVPSILTLNLGDRQKLDYLI